jgi:ankyrin repeat protein
LHCAVLGGHESAAALLIRAGAEPPSGFQVSPLYLAAAQGHDKLTAVLVTQYSLNSDAMPPPDASALMHAAEKNNAGVVRELLRCPNIDVNAEDGVDRETALWRAAGAGHEPVVKLLLSHPDVDVNAKDVSRRSPLTYALLRKQRHTAKLLLESPRTERNSRDFNGNTPLMLAVREGYADVVDTLLAYDDVDIDAWINAYGQSAFGMAAAHGCLNVIEAMSRRPGFRIDNNEWSGVPPPLLAPGGDSNDREAVAISLAQNVDVNPRDGRGYTPLMKAAQANNISIMNLLLRHHSVAVNCRGNDGRTALILAARSAGMSGPSESVQLLLDRQEIEVHARDNQGRTALTHAAAHQNAGVVQQFLQLREPLKWPTENHILEALLIAQTEGTPEIAQLLQESLDSYWSGYL